MKALQIVKKFNQTPVEERAMARLLADNPAVVKVVTDYLLMKFDTVSKILSNPKELYTGGTSAEYVAFRLAERAAYLKMYTVLTSKVDLLDDDLGEE